MTTVLCNLVGRFGNQLFTYCFARALAQERGYGFKCVPWIGEQIFDLNEPHNEHYDQNDVVVVRDYCQRQECLIYTRNQVKEWFRFKPNIQRQLDNIPICKVTAHRRIGDYESLGYVVVSKLSYYRAMEKFMVSIPYGIEFVTEESPLTKSFFSDDIRFLPDFYRLMKSDFIFRGNSSFSWWAATLSDAEVYSPVIEGLTGGMEQDCDFVKGNWPRLANLPFITDLHLQ